MDDNVQSNVERLVNSRAAPLLYVVDGDATILFASDGGSGSELSASIAAALRGAVRRMQRGDATSGPHVYEGRLVRCEALTGPNGAERYAVFFERIAVTESER